VSHQQGEQHTSSNGRCRGKLPHCRPLLQDAGLHQRVYGWPVALLGSSAQCMLARSLRSPPTAAPAARVMLAAQLGHLGLTVCAAHC
jgi:hypothetical protein